MGKIEIIYNIFKNSKGINTDSRTLKEGEVFIALKGENFNGNLFAKSAIDQGAAAVICDEEQDFSHHNLFTVENGLTFLQQLANHHRKALNATIIGITGSNGKTTTKELLRDVLSTTYKTQATIGNLNNHIGVPLTLLRLTQDVEMAIIEMGANHQKEIELLCKIAEPDFGYITNFGKAHLEGFGGIEGVIKGKSELYDYLRNHKKIAFINSDDPIQNEKSVGIEQITFSKNKETDYIISAIDAEFVTMQIQDNIINTQLIGDYNFLNASIAAAIGLYFKVSIQNIGNALSAYKPQMNRSEVLKTDKNTLYLDAYNANPTSMELSISNFIKLDYPNKLMILGDMFELGEFAHQEHLKVINQVEQSDILTFLVGENFSQHKVSSNILTFNNTSEVEIYLKQNDIVENAILLKGSRGMKLESLKKYL